MLFFITALSCEAEPLIEHFHLKKKEALGNFALFKNENTALAISGIGKHHAAATVGYLSGMFPGTHGWFNVGIAGHQSFGIGEGYFIHKITDSASDMRYYPVFIKAPPAKTAALITVDKPEKNYHGEALYDMEGSAFFPACMRFSSVELIHCLKIVSDNKQSPIEKIDKKTVTHLISGKMAEIEKMSENIKEILSLLEEIQLFQESDLSAFFLRWHFTETQKHTLKQLLQKWKAVQPKKTIWDETLKQLSKTEAVLRFLEEKINSAPIIFR